MQEVEDLLRHFKSRETKMAGSEKWRETSPYGLRRYAGEFIAVGHDALNCYRKREVSRRGSGYEHVPPDPIVPFPIYFNFLHGIELGLKAYLLHVNAATIDELKSKQLGHNLPNLLNKALEHDLRSNCPELTKQHTDIIHCSNETYSNKWFEYIRIGGGRLMPIDEVVTVADQLSKGLKKLSMRTADEVGLTHE